MDIVCEFCDKSFDSKSKINVHQRTKKCQQFRTITFVCRKCSSAILGYDNILFMLRTAMEQLQFCTKK